MNSGIIEDTVEQAALEWFIELGYEVKNGPDISPPDGTEQERESHSQVLLMDRLKTALLRINPDVEQPGIDEAIRQLTLNESPSLIQNNRTFHNFITDGVTVEYRNSEGNTARDIVWLFDFDRPDNNDWMACNQFTVIQGEINRRPDIVVFLNGMPISVLELKDPTNPDATLWDAYNQLQTYKNQISNLFLTNEILVISDGYEARFGSLTAGKDRFMPWRVVEDEKDLPSSPLELRTLMQGLFDKKRFLSYLKHFILFQDNDDEPIKIIAGYHQYHAVEQAKDATIKATGEGGDKRIGVVWHTQGSGKSITMVFFSAKIALQSEMRNPTIVALTDRQDLDNQLMGTFSASREILRQTPVQARTRIHLRELLTRDSGGIIFTTIQKFMTGEDGDTMPELSGRRNIVVIADEAHRSQYDFIDGYAKHMRDALPNASFIGFTGTPLEKEDKNTQAVFGDYVSVYDIQRSVKDGITVPIHYESRIAKLDLDHKAMIEIDEDFEEVTEGEETTSKERLKTKWAALEALVGSESRLSKVIGDLLEHFDSRLEILNGKAMIVCMSRRICVDVYDQIMRHRPEWGSEKDDEGLIKVIMTGAATDKLEWQQHIRNKDRRNKLAIRFRDPDDPFQIVIVRDMWLTGFDAKSLHTMYVDKPMRGHGLMQAIARVNRTFKDKPGGLIVDYIGLADELRKSVAHYTQSGGKGDVRLDIQEAATVLAEKHGILVDMFHGFDYSPYFAGSNTKKLEVVLGAQDHILGLNDGKNRYNQAILELRKAYAISKTTDTAIGLRDDISFFLDVSGRINSRSFGSRDPGEIDSAVRQLVSGAIQTGEVIDIFDAAGLKKPDISILDDEFLADVHRMPHRNLAVELLQKLLRGEIRVRRRKNLVQFRKFSDMLENSLGRYKNRAVETLQVIEELIELAKEMRAAEDRGEELGLSDSELAFYDALETNDSAVAILGDEVLREIAREVTEAIKRNTSIDWTVRQQVQAKMRLTVKKILKKHGYPPDMQRIATETVLEQAKLLSRELAVA